MLVRRSSEYLYLAINMLSNQHATNLLPTCYQLPSKLLINCYFLVVCLQENPQHTVMDSKCLFSFEDIKLLQLSADIYDIWDIAHNKKHPTHLYTRNFSSAARHQCTLPTTHGVCLCTEGWFPPHAHEPPLQQRAQVGHQGFLLLPEVESRTAIFCKWCTQIAE